MKMILWMRAFLLKEENPLMPGQEPISFVFFTNSLHSPLTADGCWKCYFVSPLHWLKSLTDRSCCGLFPKLHNSWWQLAVPQDTVVLPTQYSAGCWEKTWRGHLKLKIKAVQSELMKVGEDFPASTDAFGFYLNKKMMRWLWKGR